MLTADDLQVLLVCVETEIAYQETAACHGANTRSARATLAALSQKLAVLIEADAKKAAAEKEVKP